jgi:lysyl-tRNA synthetase class 2
MEELIRERKEKLEELRRLGINPFAYRFERSHSLGEVHTDFENLEKKKEEVSLAGRIMALRTHGKATFLDLKDKTGRVQLYIKLDIVGEKSYALSQKLDIGDFLGTKGSLFKTRTGEITVQVREFILLTKSLRPLPEKWHGLKDVEMRYRQRYLDLIVNPPVKEVFLARSKIIKFIRDFLERRRYLEVETPVLQPIYGGAAAQPFVTRHKTLDMELYLRIANELYLKRLIVGGLEKVYEFAKDFRNEGMDRLHNPEFTQLELYEAYADYNDMMNLVEEMVVGLAQKLKGKVNFDYQGEKIDLSSPWKRITLLEAIKNYCGLNVESMSDEELGKEVKKLNLTLEEKAKRGKIIDELFKNFVEPELIQPTFITDYPVELSPLAKRKRDNENLTERFEFFIGGLELGNAFSELNDPLEQRERFLEGARQRKLGDETAPVMDEDFLRALEYGMPPTGGLGIGIDRMVMLFTDSRSIREVIFFPQMKPEK